MASTYKAYLGEGLGPLEWIKQFHIPHPGRVIGRLVLGATMPGVLGWVLGGNNGHLEAARPSACRMEDRLKVRWVGLCLFVVLLVLLLLEIK
jgi:zeaxanthin epoxidase